MKDKTAFIISFVIHVGLLLFFSISIRANLTISQSPPMYMQVDFPEEQPVPTQPKPEPTKPKPEPTKKLSENIKDLLKEALKTPTPKPTRKKTPTPKPTRKPRPTNTPKAVPTPTSAPKASSTPAPEITRIPLTEIKQKPASQVSSTTNTSLSIQSDASYNFSTYGSILAAQLLRAWDQPTVLRPQRMEYSTVVTFTVSRDGSLSDVELVPSGWPILDESVKKALQKANPVEALPFGYTSNSIRVTAPFIMPLE